MVSGLAGFLVSVAALLPSLCLPGLGPPNVDGSLLLMASALPPRSMITYSMAVNLKGSAEDATKWIAMKLLQLRLVQGSVGLNHTPIVLVTRIKNASQSNMTQSSLRLIACVRAHLPRILGWDDPERQVSFLCRGIGTYLLDD